MQEFELSLEENQGRVYILIEVLAILAVKRRAEKVTDSISVRGEFSIQTRADT